MGGEYCFFIGHRDVREDIYSRLKEEAEKVIVEGNIGDFIVGHYGDFDALATRAVLELKESYPHVKLWDLLPFHPAERRYELPKGFDGTIYPEGQELVPRRIAIVRANQYAVQHCGILITYVCHPASNAQRIMEYAQKHRIPVINVGD